MYKNEIKSSRNSNDLFNVPKADHPKDKGMVDRRVLKKTKCIGNIKI